MLTFVERTTILCKKVNSLVSIIISALAVIVAVLKLIEAIESVKEETKHEE
ncbi:MAG: hypothetical protein IB616_01805 [Methanosarcinales archaeon]|nr:MAG: hypothetical protein IB616_01805 [Methanosarcinales archaeon]